MFSDYNIVQTSLISDSEMKVYRIYKLLKYLKRLWKKRRRLNQSRLRSQECEFCCIVGRLRFVSDFRTVS